MFNRDSLPTIVERVKADMQSRLSADELLRRSDALVLARVMAGMSHELLGYADWISRQILFDTSDEDVLKRQAAIWKYHQKSAEYAIGVAIANGIDGRAIGAGAVARRQDGVEYAVEAVATIEAGVADVSFKAIVKGAAGNAPAGTVLTLLSPIDGVQSQLTVKAPGFVNGADVEPIGEFRPRFIRRVGQLGGVGSLSDYETWALEVPGVTRAWATAGEMGAGTVTVRFVRDNDESLIPDGPEVDAMREYLADRRAATAILYVEAPIADPIVYQIRLTPASEAAKAAVIKELKDLHSREARPAGTLLRSHMTEAISTADGEFDHELVWPDSNVVADVGHMPTFGGVLWL